MMTDFDREFLKLDTFTNRRLRRDAALRDLGVDPEEFMLWQRDQEVGNECDTDEYRETQPSKGLGFISEFMADWGPGVAACNEMMELTKKWIDAGANMGEAYSGANELVPILRMCFDFAWEQGQYSLYTVNEVPDASDVEFYKEYYGMKVTLADEVKKKELIDAERQRINSLGVTGTPSAIDLDTYPTDEDPVGPTPAQERGWDAREGN
jgi:hypothetical protein